MVKSREFLDAAILALEAEMFNAASSNAVLSAINSKDAICLKRTGRTNKPEGHDEGAVELERSCAEGREIVPTFRRLLRVKPKAQYQEGAVSRSDALKAVAQAERMWQVAQRVVTS